MQKTCNQVDGHGSRRWAENSGCQQTAANPFLTSFWHAVAAEKRNLQPGLTELVGGLLEGLTSAYRH